MAVCRRSTWVDDGFCFDASRNEVLRFGQRIALTTNERAIMRRLFASRGETVSHAHLFEAMGYRPDLPTRALAHAIVRLRRKLGDDGSGPRRLVTVYGVGYRLEVDGLAAEG